MKTLKAKKLLSGILMAASVMTAVPATVGTTVTSVFAKTVKFSSDRLQNDLSRYSISVPVNESIQRFRIDKDEISNFKIRSTKMYNKGRSARVTVTYLLDRDVAQVYSKTQMTYSKTSSGWKIKKCSYPVSRIESINLLGSWNGKYVNSEGDMKLQLVIDDQTDDGYATGRFIFSAPPTNPTVPSGSYTIKGGCDTQTGRVVFAGDQWIDQPDGWIFYDIDGEVDLENKCIRDDEYSLIVSRE